MIPDHLQKIHAPGTNPVTRDACRVTGHSFRTEKHVMCVNIDLCLPTARLNHALSRGHLQTTRLPKKSSHAFRKTASLERRPCPGLWHRCQWPKTENIFHILHDFLLQPQCSLATAQVPCPIQRKSTHHDVCLVSHTARLIFPFANNPIRIRKPQ